MVRAAGAVGAMLSYCRIGTGFGLFPWPVVSARLLASGGRARTAVALMAGRFAVLGGVLTLASLRGAAPLLAVTLGVLLARAAVLRSLPHVLTP